MSALHEHVEAETTTSADIEEIFRIYYGRTARVIAAVIRDPGRAEELAVEVFLKWPDSRAVDASKAGAWIRRSAIRIAVDELRRLDRKNRLERAVSFLRKPKTPEECYASADRQSKIARVLGSLKRRDAELLLLRAEGLSYEELASALRLNPKSVGTVLSRAQKNFRKEYEQVYGSPE